MPSRLAVLTVLAFLGIAFSEDPAPLRPARAADLPGTWMMAALAKAPGAVLDEDDRELAPYQVFYFDNAGKMKFMTSAKPITNLALFEAAPAVTRYAVDKRGVLTLLHPSSDEPRHYLCVVVTKAAGISEDPKKARPGDIMLSHVDNSGKELWTKVLRKSA